MIAEDLASTTYGAMDGITLCGPRSYTVTPASLIFLDLTANTLTLLSTDPTEATSPLSITITATLVNYPLVPAATSTFTVEVVDYCASTTLSLNSITDMQAFVH